ncbi:MAG: hypothetical protein AMXMBFR82_32390 [Candidatus Hydrogenedentota bacterium]
MKAMSTTLAVVLAVMCCGSAMAIEPSHWGKYGNPEEPATRPYKAFWRGLKAVPYQIGISKDSGEAKADAKWGRVEGFRGLRRGVVELGHSTWWGMAGTYPPPVEDFSSTNQWIESDRRLAALCDLPTTVGVFALVSGSNALVMMFGSAAVTVAQSEVDRRAMGPEQLEANLAAAERARAQNWPANPTSRNDIRPQGLKYGGKLKEEAQEMKAEQESVYLNTPYSGDMIAKARRGRIADE